MTTDTAQPIAKFIAAYHVRMTVEYADSNPHMANSETMNHFKCTLKRGRRQLSLIFSQGFGIHGEPTAADVLDCLASDANGLDNAGSFEEWANEFGYDTDSRKAERAYHAIERQASALQSLLGAEGYTQLLYGTERF